MVAFAENLARTSGIKIRQRKSVESFQSVDGRVALVPVQISDGRQDARATIPICGSIPHRDFAILGSTGRLRFDTPPAGTRPLVNNLYQGMGLDAVTWLYYERFRNYSPSLGTVRRQEPKSRHGEGSPLREFTDDDGQSSYGASGIIYCGYKFDPETENYYVRIRYYSPVLGRWLTRDPAGFIDGANTYKFESGSPAWSLDPCGTERFINLHGQRFFYKLEGEIPTHNGEIGKLVKFPAPAPLAAYK